MRGAHPVDDLLLRELDEPRCLRRRRSREAALDALAEVGVRRCACEPVRMRAEGDVGNRMRAAAQVTDFQGRTLPEQCSL